MSWSTPLKVCSDFVNLGDEVEAVLLSIDQKLENVIRHKQLTTDPWTDITSKYPIGSQHKGVVKFHKLWGIY